MKRVLFVVLLASLISACGGGSGGSANAVEPVGDLTQEQIVEKFNLPPEPDVELNNATIEGIDSNNNDIRDDWERLIAFEHYKNPTMMNINNLRAKNYTALNKAYEEGDTSKYKELDKKMQELLSCAHFYNGEGFGSKELFDKTETTRERFIHNLRRDSAVSKVVGYGIYGSSLSQDREVCPKYAK